MNICEAVKEAIEKGCKISRPFGDDGAEIIVEPTNEADCCRIALKMPSGEIRPAHRMWNPTAKDLTAADWKLTFKKENDTLRDEAAAKRRERLERMDKVTMNALCHIEYCMSKIADEIGRQGRTTEQIAELSASMAKLASEAAALRMSMRLHPAPYAPCPTEINIKK